MLRTIHLPKNQNFKKMVGLKVHGNLTQYWPRWEKAFPDSGKQLFGDGFESRLKLRSEIVNTMAESKKAGKASFPGTAPRRFQGLSGWQRTIPSPLQRVPSPHIKLSVHNHIIQGKKQGLSLPVSRAIPAKTTAVTLVRPNHLPPGMFRNRLHSSTQFPQGGQLKHFLPAWEQITKDPWILQGVSGYQIENLSAPYL